MRISHDVSVAIKISKFLAALLIIAIHHQSINSANVETADVNYFIQEFICNGIGRVSVPLFAFMSGLLFFKSYPSLTSFKITLKKKFITIFLPYLLSSIYSFGIYLIGHIYIKHDCPGFLEIIKRILFHPISVQLWFLRDLMILFIISPILYRVYKKIGSWFVGFLFLLWFFELQLFPIVADWYLINIETFFFFVLGYHIINHIEVLENIIRLKWKYIFCLSILWVTFLACRLYIDPYFNIWYAKDCFIASLFLHKISIIFGGILVISISSKFNSRALNYLSGYTFFVFLYHGFPLNLITMKISNLVFDEKYLFYPSFFLSTIIVFFVAHLLERFLPKVYGILTGNRGTTDTYSDNLELE